MERRSADLAGAEFLAPENGAPFTPGSDRSRLEALLETLARPAPLRRIAIRDGGRYRFIPTSDVHWIEANGNNVRLHGERLPFVLRVPLEKLMARLDPAEFLRVHRGAAVNLAAIAEVEPRSRGRYLLVLRDGTELLVSRTYAPGVRRLTRNGR